MLGRMYITADRNKKNGVLKVRIHFLLFPLSGYAHLKKNFHISLSDNSVKK
jgi:hypothetical protein